MIGSLLFLADLGETIILLKRGDEKKVLFLISTLLFLWLFIRFVIGGSEDSWTCVDGQWVKHGYPAAPMPETDCDAN